MSAQRLWQVVELDHRQKVAAAAAADERHRARDELVKVRVTAPFRVAGREVQCGEIVDVPNWLVSGLQITGHVERA
jgi:hypothetical protein